MAVPEIFNTDQRAQFTSDAFVGELLQRGVRVSMDGRGRMLDSVFVERLWHSVNEGLVFVCRFRYVHHPRRLRGKRDNPAKLRV